MVEWSVVHVINGIECVEKKVAEKKIQILKEMLIGDRTELLRVLHQAPIGESEERAENQVEKELKNKSI